MATLELHDGRNQVRRVRISRENPVMVGSDPMCDVVLEGAGVQPFHGRIRWKNGRFKIDASPEVPWIEVNGVQIKSKSLQQGDEIRFGHCRIFLLSIEDGPDHGEKTTIQETPKTTAPAQSKAQAQPGKAAAVDYHRMEMAPPSIEGPQPRDTPRSGSPENPLKRSRYRKSSGLEVDDLVDLAKDDDPETSTRKKRNTKEKPPEPDPQPARTTSRREFGFLRSFERAPGDDRVMGSPLVIGLGVSFVILVAISYSLYVWIGQVNAARQYNVATENMDSGNYLNAIKGFDNFLDSNPKDKRADKARVLRAFAKVHQHTGSVGTSWGAALSEARSMIDEVGSIPEYRDSSVDLAEELRKIAEGLADRAAEVADPKGLAEAEAAVQLHGKVAGQAADAMIEKSKIPAKFEKARLAIRKSHDRTEVIAAMDEALQAKNPGQAYAARVSLIRQYPEFAADKEVTTRLTQANEQIQKAVTFDSSGRPGETEPRRDLLGPPTSLVLRLDPGKAPTTPNGPIAYALADGCLFGVDATTGAPKWQVAVGHASPFAPLAVAGSPPSVILVDSRSNELIRLDGRTGELIWRQDLGGLVADAPLVLGNQLYQPTIDGRLLQIDLISGSIRGTLQLGRKLARTPVTNDTVTHLYLLADEDCLFVLALDPLACVAVEFLGQDLGSVACPPARLGRFYVLPENTSIEQGRWRVFVIDESGTRLKQVQELPIGGWTRATPAASGSVIWSCSDRGELIAFAVGLYDAKTPFTTIARAAPSLENEGPAFPRAKTDRDFWLASSHSGRFELDLERGRFTSAWTLGEAGPALAPPQAFDKLLILTQQHGDGPGTSLWGVEAASGQVRWRTVLGSPWPVGMVGSSTGDALTTLAADGRNLSLDASSLKAGGFIEQQLPRPGTFRLPAAILQRLDVDGATVVVPEAGASKILVRADSGDFKAIELPARLATTLIPLGKNLLIPGADGRVYLIDPRTGTSTADPFVPPFDRSKPIRWRTPVLLEGDAVALADSEATIRRIAVDTTGRPRVAVTAEFKLDKPLAADPASTGSSVLVVTSDGKVRSLAARDLGPQGSWTLEARRLVGPVVVADHAFVADSAGNVLAFSPDGRRLWSAKLRDAIPVGPPAILDESAWFLGRDGSIQRFSMADGSPQSRTILDFLPDGGPLVAGPELVVPSGVGTLRVADKKILETAGGAKP
jgi:outer membrane protein assembly factor BamB/TolA-binding protein